MKTITPKILFLSTFPSYNSREAHFTKDLINALNEKDDTDLSFEVCAVEHGESGNVYQYPVSMILDGHDWNSCMRTARKIKQDPSVRLICIEYYDGLFGGDGGRFLLDFLRESGRSYVLRLHNPAVEPGYQTLATLKELAAGAEKIFVMTHQLRGLAAEVYNAGEEKIILIPHGVHKVCKTDPSDLKERAGLCGKKIIMCSGKLRRNTCLETLIHSMKMLSLEFPEVVLLVVGKTDPQLFKREGENYRKQLQSQIDASCLSENVILVNEELSSLQLMEFLAMTDVFVHIGQARDLSVNAELLNAMASGCSIISEPCTTAAESMPEETGIFTTGEISVELADQITFLLENKNVSWNLGRNAYLTTSKFTWEAIATLQLDRFREVLNSLRMRRSLSESRRTF